MVQQTDVSAVVQHAGHEEPLHSLPREGATASSLLGYCEDVICLQDSFHVALYNPSTQCYLNALLHIMARTQSLQRWVTQHADLSVTRCHSSNCILCVLARDVRRLCVGTDDTPLTAGIVQRRSSWSTNEFQEGQHDIGAAFDKLMIALNQQDEEAVVPWCTYASFLFLEIHLCK